MQPMSETLFFTPKYRAHKKWWNNWHCTQQVPNGLYYHTQNEHQIITLSVQKISLNLRQCKVGRSYRDYKALRAITWWPTLSNKQSWGNHERDQSFPWCLIETDTVHEKEVLFMACLKPAVHRGKQCVALMMFVVDTSNAKKVSFSTAASQTKIVERTTQKRHKTSRWVLSSACTLPWTFAFAPLVKCGHK